jgi:hypothetical protein
MLVSLHGIYRQGKIELLDEPRFLREETEVVVTIADPGLVDLRERGIDEEQAEELQGKLSTFSEDWDSSEMNIYDNYDAAKAKL